MQAFVSTSSCAASRFDSLFGDVFTLWMKKAETFEYTETTKQSEVIFSHVLEFHVFKHLRRIMHKPDHNDNRYVFAILSQMVLFKQIPSDGKDRSL